MRFGDILAPFRWLARSARTTHFPLLRDTCAHRSSLTTRFVVVVIVSAAAIVAVFATATAAAVIVLGAAGIVCDLLALVRTLGDAAVAPGLPQPWLKAALMLVLPLSQFLF